MTTISDEREEEATTIDCEEWSEDYTLPVIRVISLKMITHNCCLKSFEAMLPVVLRGVWGG
jgi:hypothetical protein